MKKTITIGTRGSELALWQANHIKDRLAKAGIETVIQIIKTQGDKVQHLSFDKLEGKGFFTKELEEALLAKEIDLAVHSHKDLPTTLQEGLAIAAVSEREDPSELIVIRKEAVDTKQLWNLKKNAQFGTSSARRKTQIRAYRNDLEIIDLRGNVPTRIEKLRSGQYDAIMLAAAGVERLQIDLDEFEVQKLDPKQFVPAPAQGVLAIEVRADDTELIAALQILNEPKVAAKIGIERKVLNLFDGGCQLPLGVYCETTTNDDDQLIYRVWLAKAVDSLHAPVFNYYEKESTENFAQEIVAHIESIKPCNVLITRNIHANSVLKNSLDDQKFKLHGVSFISFNPVPFRRLLKTDWIFFSSKHAVEHFFKQQPEITNQRFGAIGKSTSDALRKFGHRAEFIGQSMDTKTIGKQFAARVGAATVLFPVAKASLRSIQYQFTRKEQAIDLVVYETIEHEVKKLPKAEILVFTSPSNVTSYFKTFTVQPKHRVIAIGAATEAELRKHGVRKSTLPQSFDDLGLLQAIYKLAI